MEKIIEQELIEELSIDENLHVDMDCFVDKYLNLLPDISIDDDDVWDVSLEMIDSFNKSIDRMKEKKSNSKIKK